MIKSEGKCKKMSSEEVDGVTGGFVVKVSKNDIEKVKLDLKEYLVIDKRTRKVIDSFDNYEDALVCDVKANSKDNWIHQVKEGDLENHLGKSLDGAYTFKS